jgi:hypothetical protein
MHFRSFLLVSFVTLVSLQAQAGQEPPDDYDLFTSIQLSSKDIKNPWAITRDSKSGKTLENAEELLYYLIDDSTAPIRAAIIDIAKEKKLTQDVYSEPFSRLKKMIGIPGSRKLKDFRVFPQAYLNNFTPSELPFSYFFKSPSSFSPKLEIVNTASQVIEENGQEVGSVPLIMFKLPESNHSREVYLGLFHPETIALSYRSLKEFVSKKTLKQFRLFNQLKRTLNKPLNFELQFSFEGEKQSPTEMALLKGPFQIKNNLSAFGRKDLQFGLYSQGIEHFNAREFGIGVRDVNVHYNHFNNKSDYFTVKALHRSQARASQFSTPSVPLYVRDVYLTIDSFLKFRVPESEASSSENSASERIIVDLGSNDCFLLTTVEILEALVNNVLRVRGATSDLPQGGLNLTQWITKWRNQVFPKKEVAPESLDFVLPSGD